MVVKYEEKDPESEPELIDRPELSGARHLALKRRPSPVNCEEGWTKKNDEKTWHRLLFYLYLKTVKHRFYS